MYILYVDNMTVYIIVILSGGFKGFGNVHPEP